MQKFGCNWLLGVTHPPHFHDSPFLPPTRLSQHPFSLGTVSCWEALRGKETSQGKRSSYEQITVGTGKPPDKGKGTTERELCNWLSMYVFQNTVSRYPTSQGDKKESFSVQACYILKKAHDTCKDRARRQRPEICTAHTGFLWHLVLSQMRGGGGGGSLDFCFLSLPLFQLPRVMQPGPILGAFCGDRSCAVWLYPRCRGKCWFSMLPLLLKEDNNNKEHAFLHLRDSARLIRCCLWGVWDSGWRRCYAPSPKWAS